MAKGRKKTPTAKLQNRGSWRAKTRTAEPVYDSVDFNMKPPKGLGFFGSKLWKDILPLIVNQGVLTKADLAAFKRYCIYWQKWNELINDDMAPLTDLSKIEAALSKLECQFGLTPASRPNIKANKASDDSDSRQKNYFKVV